MNGGLYRDSQLVREYKIMEFSAPNGDIHIIPHVPKAQGSFWGRQNVEYKRQGSGYDSSKFRVAVVACTPPRQSKFQMVEGESHQDPPLPETLLANDD